MQLVYGGIYSRRHQYLKVVVINCNPLTFLLITLLISEKPEASRKSIFYLLLLLSIESASYPFHLVEPKSFSQG